jgi:alpha-L-rhamnosidase
MIRPLAAIGAWLRIRSSRRSLAVIDARTILEKEDRPASAFFRGGSKPYARWWWLAGPFRHEDIRYQLAWLESNGFGGVELAWLWPSWMGGDAEPGVEWLSAEWSSLIAFTKQEADRLGLGCDFTFGSCWPFGGSVVARTDAARTFDGLSRQRLHGSWEGEHTGELRVLNHLDRSALGRYAEALMPAFASGLRGSPSALFCDSLEIETRRLWDSKLWDRFAERFAYRLEGLEDQIDDDPDLRFDYRTLIAETILHEFYEEFAAICRAHGALSRVQCHGAPTDLLAAYAAVDIPESEAILFPPTFSRIAASAAALSGKTTVSAETFTCLYGFVTRSNPEPYRYWHKEQVADLKLLADALFANGVNQIVWHGMPFNGPAGRNEFYASVHVAPGCAFAAELPAFNSYLELVSSFLKLGRVESRLAVYLPNEDNRQLDRIPDEERTPAAVYRWEMRHVVFPRETEGYAPLWISGAFLKDCEIVDGRLRVGDCSFSALLIDVEWLDGDALAEIVRLAEAGALVVLPSIPRAPGKRPRDDYQVLLDRLQGRENVVRRLADAHIRPLVKGGDIPPFWARNTAESLYLFFGHPMVRDVQYPLRYGQSLCRDRLTRRIAIDFEGISSSIVLVFEPYQSILLRVSLADGVQILDLAYQPPVPQTNR